MIGPILSPLVTGNNQSCFSTTMVGYLTTAHISKRQLTLQEKKLTVVQELHKNLDSLIGIRMTTNLSVFAKNTKEKIGRLIVGSICL